MTSALLVAGGVFGTLVGSFVNVVVHRVPSGRSVVSPPSACPRCGARIRSRDNIPLLSWLLLRGRCRSCSESIPARYPLVELATGAAFVVVVLVFGPPLTGAGSPVAAVSGALGLLGYLYLAGVSIALLLIDVDTHRLPNRVVVPAIPVLLVVLGTSSALHGRWEDILRLVIGGCGLFLAYLVLALASRGGMGFGDVKLAAVLGIATAWVGWPALAVGVLAGFVLGGLFGLALLAARRAGRRTAIPFGPWMIVGAWIGILAGDPIASGYLRLFGLA